MKVTYDAGTDITTLIFRQGVPVAESDEGKPGFVLDYDAQGELIGVEILDASQRVSDPRQVEFRTIP